jgi:putative ABC transport system permease protein
MVALPVGTTVSLFYFLYVVVRISPYYDPQYVIPVAGMIIGNSMTGISLGIHTMINRFTDQKDEVETALMLGATPKEASKSIVDEAFDSAMMPTLNSMLGMGIVFLPGMMTGQILSGVSPLLAISYQIGIMMGILGGVSLTTYIFLKFGYRTFFNRAVQLKSY